MDKDPEAQTPLNGSSDYAGDGGLNQSESRTPLKTPTKEIEVKYVASDSANGEPRVQLDHNKTEFSGMTKDELLKYVNDPFWVRMRTILFILFWVTWLAMFAAAIAIVVMAPRCEAPKQRQWYEEGPIAKVDLPQNEKSLADLAKKIGSLEDVKVKAIILPDLTRKVNGDTADFKSISSGYGTLEDFEKLATAAKEKAIKLIISLVPNYSSDQHEWFMRSAAKNEPFTDFFVWKSTGTEDKLPNNWLSVNGGSAWTYHKGRREFYLHQFGSSQPDINFRSSKVQEEFKAIFNFWLSLGVSGFSFDKTQYLLEDASLENEVEGGIPGAEHTQYQFWNHIKTYNLPETADLLASWRDIIKTNDTTRIVIIHGEPPIAANMNTTSADLFRGEPLLLEPVAALSPNLLNERLTRVLKRQPYTDWPAVDVLPPGKFTAELGSSAVDALNLLTLLLPGTPLVQLGDEYGMKADGVSEWLESTNATSDDNPHFNLFKEVSRLRSTQAVLHGTTDIAVINNGSAIAVTRWKAGSPGYIAVWSSSADNVTLDLSGPPHLPAELITTAVGASGGPPPNGHVPTDKIPLPPNASALFTFVPAEVDA